jgi:UDP-N-acetylmuramyl pentapeptide phosphotransferase/UDP-N-acetylglucosamine-1-phosphate transferase
MIANALAIPYFTWLISLLGTKLALMLLTDLKVLDKPNERSNHSLPVPRGGGIAMVISMLLFLAHSGVEWHILMAGLILAAVSFADDLKGMSVTLRLSAQLMAVGVALMVEPIHLFPPFVPHLLQVAFVGVAWIWFINLTNFMDGIDGITSIETILVSVGICLVCKMTPHAPPLLAQQALIVAVAALGFYWFNGWPAKVFMGDVGSITLGFLMGFMLLRLAMAGEWISALILPAYHLSDATTTLVKRLLKGQKIWQAHSLHAYQQAARAGRSHREVVCRICGLNVVLVLLAMGATISMMSGIAMLVIAYGLTACLLRHFTKTHAPVPG